MAREYPFQVVPKPNVLPDAVKVSGTELIGRSLQSALTMGLQAATSGLSATNEQLERQNTMSEAAAKMLIAGEQVKQNLNIAKVEQQQNAEDNAYKEAAIKLEESEDKRAALEKKVKLGLAATIASKPLPEVEALMNRGNGWILDPEALQFAEELYGKRLAQEDMGKALNIIGVEVQKDPNVSFSSVIDKVAESRQFGSGTVSAAYLSTLRDSADRYFTSKQIEVTEQRLKEGVDTLKLSLVHEVTFDARENLLTGENVLNRLVKFEQDYKKLKPAASQLEVLAQTADVLDKAFDGKTIALNLPQMAGAFKSVQALAEVNPGLYGPILTGIGERIAKARNDGMQANYDSFKTRIDAASDNGSLSSIMGAMQSMAAEGGFTSDGYIKLNDQLLSAMEKNKRKQAVSEVLSGANSQTALTENDDKTIDSLMTERAAGNGWNFAQLVGETARTANRLTKSQLDSLRGLANVTVDPANPQSAEAVNNAVAGFEAVRDSNPRLAREIAQADGAGRRLSVLSDVRYYFGLNPVNVAQELEKATEQDFIQADSILEGKVSTPEATKAADFNAIVDSEFNGYFRWDVDRPANEASQAYKSAFRYAYAIMKSEGKGDEKTVVNNARKEATRLVQSGFYRVSLGTDDVFPDTHLVSRSRFPYDPSSKMGENFMSVADNEFNKARWSVYLANRNVIDDADDITVDLDAAEIKNGQMVVPFTNRKTGMLLRDKNGTAVSFSVPVGEEELKAKLKSIAEENKVKSYQVMTRRWSPKE